SKPVIRLKKVVLPAPLGPMRPVIALAWISRCSTSTAVMPPKRRTRPATDRIASRLGAPGRGSTWSKASVAIERHLPLVPEDPLLAEDHESTEEHAGDDQRDLAGLHAVHHRLGDVAVADALAQD